MQVKLDNVWRLCFSTEYRVKKAKTYRFGLEYPKESGNFKTNCLRLQKNNSLHKGVARGGGGERSPGVPLPPFVSLFKSKTRRGGRHDNLENTLIGVTPPFPFEKSWLRPCVSPQ